jgi:hypothetical protein
LDPTGGEIALSKVRAFLDEIETGRLITKHLSGYHPDVYNKGTSRSALDGATAKLCALLSDEDDVTKYSLELQMWWRDHQAADERRKLEEKKEAAIKQYEMAGLDENVIEALDAHFEHGLDPGSFGRALLDQDYKAALLTAHELLSRRSIIAHMEYAEKLMEVHNDDTSKSTV